MNVNDEEFAMLDDIVSSIYNRGIKDGSADVKMRVEGAYAKGLEDAWNVIIKIENMTGDEFKNVFGFEYDSCFYEEVSVSEAMQKIKEYEQQKQDEKSCGTCKHVMLIDCGAYPCNECPRDTLPKWEPKQADEIKEYEERHDCENCAKGISAECVVDGCEFEPKQNEKLCDRCKNSKLCELSYLKYVNTCSDFCPKTDAIDSDEIKVGDEVIHINTGRKFWVTKVDEYIDGISVDGALFATKLKKFWRKTGRHCGAIAEVLEQLRGEEK